MSALGRRLVRLSDVLRPAGCRPGPACGTAWHVRSDRDDPANPAPAATCPGCGRPRPVRELVVVGVDVSKI